MSDNKKKVNLKAKFKLAVSLLSAATVASYATPTSFTLIRQYQEHEIVSDIESGIPVDAIASIKFDDNRIRLNSYTDEDLRHATEATIRLSDTNDYSFINEMVNLEKLTITDYRTLPITEIDGSVFNKKMDITIINHSMNSAFTEDKYSFLSDIKYINELYLTNDDECSINRIPPINIESSFLESLKNVHSLKLKIDVGLLYNYKDLTHLDYLYLEGMPYDIPVYFSIDDINGLKEAGVQVMTKDSDALVYVCNKIDEIVESLNIPEDATDKEKLDAIMIYILSNYSYDPEFVRSDNIFEKFLMVESDFYNNGFLYGSLENGTQICGNYSSMLNAMAHNLGLNVYHVYSDTHAWNLIEINGAYYYVDATYLDHDKFAVIIDNIKKKVYLEDILASEEYNEIVNYLDRPDGGRHKDPIAIPVDTLVVKTNMDGVRPSEADLRYYGGKKSICGNISMHAIWLLGIYASINNYKKDTKKKKLVK